MKLFNNIKPQKPKKPIEKVVPKEVPPVAPPRMKITVQLSRVHITVESPRVRAPRIPLISW